MGAHKELIEEVDIATGNGQYSEGSETAAYISDLLGELQVIAKLAGLSTLSQDITALLSKHSS